MGEGYQPSAQLPTWGQFYETFSSVTIVLESESNSYTYEWHL